MNKLLKDFGNSKVKISDSWKSQNNTQLLQFIQMSIPLGKSVQEIRQN